MKKIYALGSLILAVGLAASCSKGGPSLPNNPVSEEEEAKGNLVSNGSFSADYSIVNGNNYQGLGPWGIYAMAGGSCEFVPNENHQCIIKTDLSHANSDYSVQLNQKGKTVTEAAEYTISFDIYAQKAQTGHVIIQQNYDPYTAYFEEEFQITTETQHFEYKYKCDVTDDQCSFVFNLGKYPGDDVIENTIVVDNIKWICTAKGNEVVEEHKNVLVNQVGFLPDSKKTAVFRSNFADRTFDIIDVETGQSVYQGTVSSSLRDFDSLDFCGVADFSDFKTPGRYILRGEVCGDSYTFEIKDGVYDDLLSSMTRMLYLQRCGTEVVDTTFGHRACHTDTATVYGTSEKIDVTGGWHDAGDYGKYVVPGAKTVEDLLLTYDTYCDISYATDTKEGGKLLEEAAYELDWMLKMQKSNGEVYHKVSSYSFPNNDVLPEMDKMGMVVSPVSYAATADFAAVMAHAAKTYQKSDEARAASYKAAAIKAYNALSSMDKKSYTNPSEITTGEYPDSNLNDELLWASAELYDLTKEDKYKTSFTSGFKATSDIGFGWDNMIGYAYYTYMKLGLEDSISTQILSSMKSNADTLAKNIEDSRYGSCISLKYPWGSNMTICNAAMLFLLLEGLGCDSYTTYVQSEIDYLLGMNTIEYCYVTGFGEKSPVNPHHRVCIAKKAPVPGMLVGGPNNDFENNGNDSVATSRLQNKVSAAASYIDDNNSWSTNEVTIYWNSPLIYVLAGRNSQ